MKSTVDGNLLLTGEYVYRQKKSRDKNLTVRGNTSKYVRVVYRCSVRTSSQFLLFALLVVDDHDDCGDHLSLHFRSGPPPAAASSVHRLWCDGGGQPELPKGRGKVSIPVKLGSSFAPQVSLTHYIVVLVDPFPTHTHNNNSGPGILPILSRVATAHYVVVVVFLVDHERFQFG